MAATVCPQCGGHIHRSHSRGAGEKLVKALTSHKTYRCHDCGWRGWLSTGDAANRRNKLRTIISILVTLVVTTLLALYVVEKLSVPTANPGFEQPQAP